MSNITAALTTIPLAAMMMLVPPGWSQLLTHTEKDNLKDRGPGRPWPELWGSRFPFCGIVVSGVLAEWPPGRPGHP
ncbi:MAG: hypothetical protein EHM14_02590 [Methanothrix sp.]|nr:MAG: hypothetical protein EHM14_02590 [Methanothrix sp.]